MTDYGIRRPKTPKAVFVVLGLAAALGAAVVGTIEGHTFLMKQRENVAKAQDWAITGQPCPEISKAAYEAMPRSPERVTEYGGMTMARQNGHLSCDTLKTAGGKGFGSYPACQLTSPATLRVVTRKGEHFYNPGFGQAVTVTAVKGEAACVLAAKFRMN